MVGDFRLKEVCEVVRMRMLVIKRRWRSFAMIVIVRGLVVIGDVEGGESGFYTKDEWNS